MHIYEKKFEGKSVTFFIVNGQMPLHDLTYQWKSQKDSLSQRLSSITDLQRYWLFVASIEKFSLVSAVDVEKIFCWTTDKRLDKKKV